MIKLSRFAAPVLAACLLLAGCFTSEEPLFDPAAGAPILGPGRVHVEVHEEGAPAPEGGMLTLTALGYLDETDDSKATVSFHRLKGADRSWYVAQSRLDANKDGYIYQLYRVKPDRIEVYSMSCADLTANELKRLKLARDERGGECKLSDARTLARAFRILSKRVKSDSYWTVVPAQPAPLGPAPPAPAPAPG